MVTFVFEGSHKSRDRHRTKLGQPRIESGRANHQSDSENLQSELQQHDNPQRTDVYVISHFDKIRIREVVPCGSCQGAWTARGTSGSICSSCWLRSLARPRTRRGKRKGRGQLFLFLAVPGSMLCTILLVKSTDRAFRWTGLTNRV